MAYFYKDELHLIEEGYQKLARTISKKLKEITNSNHVPSTTPKKTPNKFVDTYFPSKKSVTESVANKRHKLHAISTLRQTRSPKVCNCSDKKQRVSNTRHHSNYVQ